MRILNHLEEVKGIFTRSKIMYAIILFSFILLTMRMFWLQLYKGDDFYRRGKNNFILSEKIAAARGDIVASDGTLLATTKSAFKISIVPLFFASGRETHDNLKRLASILHLSYKVTDSIEKKLNSCHGRCKYRPITILDELTKTELLKVVGYLSNMPGVIFSPFYTRSYPKGEAAAHITGYIAKINSRERKQYPDYQLDSYIGKTGIEKSYEKNLRGTSGAIFHVIDNMGRKIEMSDIADQELPSSIPSVKGATVTTSIMASLQDEAAEFLSEHSGAIVVMEVETGRVLTLASGPSYNPNLLCRRVLPTMVWNQYSKSILRPLINKSVSSTFFPGSTFKVVPAMAGLYHNIITPRKEYLCLGCLTFGRETKCCWNRGGHGWVDLRQSLKESCDIYYYYLSKDLGIDRLTSFASLFGVGSVTGIDLPSEERGVLPNRSWFGFNHPGQYLHSGYVMNTAIGQGDIRMTPLQIASLYSAIANNGVVMKPKIVDEITDSAGKKQRIKSEVSRVLNISPSIYKTIMKALWAVTNEAGGTAYYHADRTIPDAIGKTGTSQVIANIDRRRIDYTEDEKRILTKDDALFVALFPYKNPKIVAVAVVEHGGHGGSAAAPIVYRLLRRWYLEQGRAK